MDLFSSTKDSKWNHKCLVCGQSTAGTRTRRLQPYRNFPRYKDRSIPIAEFWAHRLKLNDKQVYSIEIYIIYSFPACID